MPDKSVAKGTFYRLTPTQFPLKNLRGLQSLTMAPITTSACPTGERREVAFPSHIFAQIDAHRVMM